MWLLTMFMPRLIKPPELEGKDRGRLGRREGGPPQRPSEEAGQHAAAGVAHRGIVDVDK
jgi:hypothetical protein